MYYDFTLPDFHNVVIAIQWILCLWSVIFFLSGYEETGEKLLCLAVGFMGGIIAGGGF